MAVLPEEIPLTSHSYEKVTASPSLSFAPLALQTSVVPACAFVGVKTAEVMVGGLLDDVPWQTPLTYTSPVVLGSPSSHAVPSAGGFAPSLSSATKTAADEKMLTIPEFIE